MPLNRREKLERYVLAVIEERRNGWVDRAVRLLLRGFSLVFRLLVQLRLWMYRQGWFRQRALGCQVISVGNLTVGGTGKTPVVETIARELSRAGRKVAILSRGYKKESPPLWRRLLDYIRGRRRRLEPLVVSDGQRLLLDSATGGDEPFMLASNLPDVVVLVGRDRVRSGRRAIQEFGCDTLILDDGFQYLRLRHRLDVVLVDRTNPFGNHWLLPAGILREPVRNIRRANFIFITKSTGDGAAELKATLRRYNPDAEISECRHCPRYLREVYTRETRPLEFLKGLDVGAISGIAAPKGFEEVLVNLGARVLYHKRYADHHRYTQQEIIEAINKAMARGAKALITTEKDAVRFPHIERRDLPVYYLRVEIEMLSGSEAFRDWIHRICFRPPGG
jgi:tetraacyldisaccharide 4'-kinase